MRRIDIRELPNESNEDLGTGETYRIERNGETVGFLVPIRRPDAEERERAMVEFDEMIQRMRSSGWKQEDIEAAFDLSRPDPLPR